MNDFWSGMRMTLGGMAGLALVVAVVGALCCAGVGTTVGPWVASFMHGVQEGMREHQ